MINVPPWNPPTPPPLCFLFFSLVHLHLFSWEKVSDVTDYMSLLKWASAMSEASLGENANKDNLLLLLLYPLKLSCDGRLVSCDSHRSKDLFSYGFSSVVAGIWLLANQDILQRLLRLGCCGRSWGEKDSSVCLLIWELLRASLFCY